jgi:hypothetical protein
MGHPAPSAIPDTRHWSSSGRPANRIVRNHVAFLSGSPSSAFPDIQRGNSPRSGQAGACFSSHTLPGTGGVDRKMHKMAVANLDLWGPGHERGTDHRHHPALPGRLAWGRGRRAGRSRVTGTGGRPLARAIRMFSGWEIGRWNPPNATLVPSWRGRPSPTGLDSTTASKLLPGGGLVLRRGATRGTTTGWREVSEPPGTIGRSLPW